MNDGEVGPNNTAPALEGDYEPPAIFDFGRVFVTTRGNSTGTTDQNNQRD